MKLRSYPLSMVLITLVLGACKGMIPVEITSTPSVVPSETINPPTTTPVSTPTMALAPGPADQYLPKPSDFADIYVLEEDILADNLKAQGLLPIGPENVSAISYKNNSTRGLTNPQDGYYIRFKYWIFVLPDLEKALLYYKLSTTGEFLKQAFLSIMPSAIFENSPCDDARLFKVGSDVFGELEVGAGSLEATAVSAQALTLSQLPPDLYLYAPCRVKNVLIAFWGYTTDNYDGNEAPIPEDVLVDQVNQFLEKVTRQVKTQPF